ncbi:MAG: hypothetical protein JWQ03_3219 [Variovorax sp.]|nr:hypothetical protein [Variovorax sp.]
MNNEQTPLSAEEEASIRERTSRDAGLGNFEIIPRILATLDAERTRANALAAWKCVNCGACFEQSISPEELEGVTWCSSCAENQALNALVDDERAARLKAEAERDALKACLLRHHLWHLEQPHNGRFDPSIEYGDSDLCEQTAPLLVGEQVEDL